MRNEVEVVQGTGRARASEAEAVNLNSESAGERPTRDIVAGEFFKSARRPVRVGQRQKLLKHV